MKVCLYLEFLYFWDGFLYKKIGTGLLSSYKNQKIMLERMGIEYVEKWDDSCDILQINTPWPKSLWLMKRARRKGKKIIVWSHVTAEDTQGVFKITKYIFGLIKWYLKHAYDSADLILAPSEYTKSLLVAYGISPDKIVAQSNGVDLKKYYPDRERGLKTREQFGLNKTVVGTVGLVIPRKGIDIFIELAKKFPDCQFIWFGKIYSTALVRSLPKEIPANCRFTGYVDDILGAFNAIDIFIFPSVEENQGMVILEAAAVGLPILVRDIPVYRGWLEHEKNCLKANNDGDFQNELARLIAGKEFRQQLVNGEKDLVYQNDIDRLGEKMMILYQNF
ncbi:MAG: glycosyltransferase family 4 protein [Minisyncoccia bacterium]